MKFALTSTAGVLHDYDEQTACVLRRFGFTFGEPNNYGRMKKLTEGVVEISTLEELIALHHEIDCELILSSTESLESGERFYGLEIYDDHHD